MEKPVTYLSKQDKSRMQEMIEIVRNSIASSKDDQSNLKNWIAALKSTDDFLESFSPDGVVKINLMARKDLPQIDEEIKAIEDVINQYKENFLFIPGGVSRQFNIIQDKQEEIRKFLNEKTKIPKIVRIIAKLKMFFRKKR